MTSHYRQAHEQVIEATLAADGDQTILAWEERGMPLDHLAEARWGELLPAYQELAANVS